MNQALRELETLSGDLSNAQWTVKWNGNEEFTAEKKGQSKRVYTIEMEED